MYQLAITRDFIAQHYLIGGDWGRENEQHSHHYKVEVRVQQQDLDQHGYLIDIVDLESSLGRIIDSYQENTLNDLVPFKDLNPSLERFARVIWEELVSRLDIDGSVLSVRLWENENDWAAYRQP
jgi:6-pyruvoyltetrahydropterin/6-carboxytetrahydropterin synthase